jgi:hypothetical protein
MYERLCTWCDWFLAWDALSLLSITEIYQFWLRRPNNQANIP